VVVCGRLVLMAVVCGGTSAGGSVGCRQRMLIAIDVCGVFNRFLSSFLPSFAH
jgi:hypothetical protein